MTHEEQEAFFSNYDKVYQKTIHFHFVSGSAGKRETVFEVDQKIIDIIVGDMFFNPIDDADEPERDEFIHLD